ncbi:MAG: 50S ribosomal protein L3 [Deltaproteobacteria bacterium]|nr:50S ribosomal protein L3 [Deltaproteobacteria bacterium]
MNQSMGLLGRKLGATQVFADDGLVERVTVIEVGPCVVFQRRTAEKDGYWALVLGFEDKPDKLVKKPDLGPYVKDGSPLKKAGVNPKRMLREIRLPQEIVEKYEVGQTISAADVFESGQFVDVTGITKGRGFAGVFKRYRMRGGSRTHGTHEAFRHGGSIGQCMTPGHVYKGKKMPGHHGSKRRTVQNLRIVDVLDEKNVILVKGPVPGHARGIVTVRKAVKKSAAKS